MVAASILPVSIHKGKLYFLFGKENELEDSAKGFSDFGGGVENGESILETATREGAEELCGFLGDSSQIKRLLKTGVYKLVHNDYHIHIFVMNYDENLPCFFTNHHRFLWDRMDTTLLNNSKYFEKQEIRWFSTQELRSLKSLFRPFYREIVDDILSHVTKIAAFANKRKNTRTTCSLKKIQRKNSTQRRLMKGG
jgi:8-oxo-dGTP pyrophosphatase MutT (NUDIX family)